MNEDDFYKVKCICGHTRAHHEVDEFRCGEDGCECPRFIALADHPKLQEIERILAAVYEGRLTDRDRTDVVTVKLPHDTWQRIQYLWYKLKREA